MVDRAGGQRGNGGNRSHDHLLSNVPFGAEGGMLFRNRETLLTDKHTQTLTDWKQAVGWGCVSLFQMLAVTVGGLWLVVAVVRLVLPR